MCRLRQFSAIKQPEQKTYQQSKSNHEHKASNQTTNTASDPLAQQTHQPHPRYQPGASQGGPSERRPRQITIHPVARQHIDDTDPEQDARAERVERADGDNRRRIVAVELVEHAEADGHADGRDERKGKPHEQLGPERGDVGGGQLGGGGVRERRRQLADLGAERDALEHLVEDDDDEQGAEDGVAGDDEGEADDCGVSF